MPTILTTQTGATGRPDVAHELLGRQLRRLREHNGIKQEAASAYIDGSPSKISRMELGRTGVSDTDLDRLLTLYGVNDTRERQALLELTRRLNDRSRWHAYSDVLPGWLSSYLVLESVAQHVRTYEVRFIPGLLQTEAYAEAVIRRHYSDAAEVRRRVDVRMQRQRMVLEQGAPMLWAIVDEAALRQPIGSPDVMEQQIEFLIHATKYPNVRIQVLPTGEGGNAGIGNSFSMLRLRVNSISDVVYLEHIESAVFLGSPAESDPYKLAMNRLSVAASKPQETKAIFERTQRQIRCAT